MAISEDDASRINVIVQHIQKNKKLVLPKTYVRNAKTYQVEYANMDDELVSESVLCITSVPPNQEHSTNIFEPTLEVKNNKRRVTKKNTDEKVPSTKRPSAYNIFVKETVKKLQETHKHLSSKERFQLAIQMWNDTKTKQAPKDQGAALVVVQ